MSVSVRVPAFLGAQTIRHPEGDTFLVIDKGRLAVLGPQLDAEGGETRREDVAVYSAGQWISAAVDPEPSPETLRLSELEEEAADLRSQIGELADCILEEIPGEPSESAGAVETACRLLRNYARLLDSLDRPSQAAAAPQPEPPGLLQLAESDDRLLWLLRRAGDEWGPLGVALTAALLSDPQAVARNLQEATAEPEAGYTVELGGQVFTQAQWEAVLVWRSGTSMALDPEPADVTPPPSDEQVAAAREELGLPERVEEGPNDALDPRRDDLEPLVSSFWVRGTRWLVVSRTWKRGESSLTVHLVPESELVTAGRH